MTTNNNTNFINEPSAAAIKVAAEHYFGGCPVCGDTDGSANNGPHHWGICETHLKKWYIGSNLFSSWKYETEEEREKSLQLLAQYAQCEALHVTPEVLLRLQRATLTPNSIASEDARICWKTDDAGRIQTVVVTDFDHPSARSFPYPLGAAPEVEGRIIEENPDTPERLFGKMLADGFASSEEMANTIRQFSLVDGIEWAEQILSGYESQRTFRNRKRPAVNDDDIPF